MVYSAEEGNRGGGRPLDAPDTLLRVTAPDGPCNLGRTTVIYCTGGHPGAFGALECLFCGELRYYGDAVAHRHQDALRRRREHADFSSELTRGRTAMGVRWELQSKGRGTHGRHEAQHSKDGAQGQELGG